MSVGWLIDADSFQRYCDSLAAAVVEIGGQVKMLNHPAPPYRWEDAAKNYREAFPRGRRVITHADIGLCLNVATHQDWIPGVFANVNALHCSRYYPHFDRFLLNRDFIMLPFHELVDREERLFQDFGREGRIFVRPDSPLKLFTGMIASRDSYAKDLECMGFYDFPRDVLVIVSSPKEIEFEWRFLVAQGEIISGSQYKQNDQMEVVETFDPKAFELAKAAAKLEGAPDPVWVIDICRTREGGYHILEIGGFSFADLYGCDMRLVACAVSHVVANLPIVSSHPRDK